MYLTLFMCLHVVGFITIYILPRFLRGEKRTATDEKTATTATAAATPTSTPADNATAVPATITKNGIKSSRATIQPISVGNGNCATNDNHLADEHNESCDKPIKSNGTTAIIDETNKLNDIDDATVQTQTEPKTNGHRNQVDDNIGQRENLSHFIRKRIDSETRNLEKLVDKTLDKTVSGIVEFKDDLMRVGDDEQRVAAAMLNGSLNGGDGGLRKRNHSEVRTSESGVGVDAFLKREINVAVNQVNVLPAVLSNGHGAD